jgi:hypothetical protein
VPSRLAEDGVLLLQLHRRVMAAGPAELPALRAALDTRAFTEATNAGGLEEIMGLAA